MLFSVLPHVITRLGRNTDLILRDSFSAVHLAFEIHPDTFVVNLSVRRKRVSSVSVSVLGDAEEKTQTITGDCAIIYGQEYRTSIAAYDFEVIWHEVKGVEKAETLRSLAIRGYEDSLAWLKNVRSRDLSVPETSMPNSWYMTRLQSSKVPLVTEANGCRTFIGEGAFGKVYKTVDSVAGSYFAVKVVDLRSPSNINAELARAALHKEVKILQSVSHANIIECLGTWDFRTDKPLIFMPLRPGSLNSLVAAKGASDELCNQVMAQMLSALDYLAFRNLCHRDVKAPNILYEAIGQDKYTFQLADFGMANHFRLANTICGTPLYQAPEMSAELYGKYPQTPKMDVWSLFATVAEIHPCFDCPPKDWSRYEYIKRAVEAAADSFPKFKPMTRVNPEHRASAVKMLIRFYDGQGLTTPRADIPDLEPDCPKPTPTVARAELTPRQAPLRLVEYPRRRQHAQHARPAPRPAPRPDILQNRPLSSGQPFTQALRARVQQGGIVIRVAQQTKPEPRRPQEKQRRETWPQELPPPSYRKEPPQRGGTGNIQTSRTADSVVPMESVATPCLQGMFPV